MCRYEKCCQKQLMSCTSSSTQALYGSVKRNANFFKILQAFPWRREWVKALLRHIHRIEDISPLDQPNHSLETVDYLEMVGYKITRGIKNIKYEDTYDEWIRLLIKSGFIHPLWNKEDCEIPSTKTPYPRNKPRWTSFRKSCHSRDRACGSPTS